MEPAGDRSADLERLRLVLEALGYDARFAPDANAALVVSSGEQPRLLLVDLDPPGGTGLELARRWAAQPWTRGGRVIALTSRPSAEGDEEARAAGCTAYVRKSADVRALIELVGSVVGSPREGVRD